MIDGFPTDRKIRQLSFDCDLLLNGAISLRRNLPQSGRQARSGSRELERANELIKVETALHSQRQGWDLRRSGLIVSYVPVLS